MLAASATYTTSQQQAKTLEVYARKNKSEVDGALAKSYTQSLASGIAFHTVENPYFRTLLSTVGPGSPSAPPTSP